jgi:hypothetical protein
MQTIVGALQLAHHMKMPLLTSSRKDVQLRIVNFKQKKHSTTHKQIFEDLELTIGSDKERLKKHKLEFDNRKFRSVPNHNLRRWMGML